MNLLTIRHVMPGKTELVYAYIEVPNLAAAYEVIANFPFEIRGWDYTVKN